MKPDIVAWISWLAWIVTLIAVARVAGAIVAMEFKSEARLPAKPVQTIEIRPTK